MFLKVSIWNSNAFWIFLFKVKLKKYINNVAEDFNRKGENSNKILFNLKKIRLDKIKHEDRSQKIKYFDGTWAIADNDPTEKENENENTKFIKLICIIKMFFATLQGSTGGTIVLAEQGYFSPVRNILLFVLMYPCAENGQPCKISCFWHFLGVKTTFFGFYAEINPIENFFIKNFEKKFLLFFFIIFQSIPPLWLFFKKKNSF